MTPEEIKALKELCEKATPECPLAQIGFLDNRKFAKFRAEDIDFYQAAREAVPKLIEEVERLRDGYLVDEHGNEYVQVCILKEKIREQDAKLAQTVEVLKWYAEANYQLDVSQEGIKDYLKRAYNDCGHRARALLKEWGVE